MAGLGDNVGWETLLRHAEAGRDLAQAHRDLARAHRDSAAAVRLMASAFGKEVPFVVGVAAGVEVSTQCGSGDPAGDGGGGAKWLLGTKRTPSVLELLCSGALKTDASEVGLFPVVGVHEGGIRI